MTKENELTPVEPLNPETLPELPTTDAAPGTTAVEPLGVAPEVDAQVILALVPIPGGFSAKSFDSKDALKAALNLEEFTKAGGIFIKGKRLAPKVKTTVTL